MIATRLAMIVAAVITARPLGPSGKGVVTAVMTWSQILAWLSIAGMNTAASVRVAESRASTTSRAVGNAVLYSVVAGGVAAGFGALVLPKSLNHLGADVRPLVLMTVAVAPLIALTEILLAIHLAMHRIVQYNLSRLAAPAVPMAVAIIGLATHHITATIFVMGLTGGSFAAFVMTLPNLPWREIRVAPKELFEDLRFGGKLMVASLMSFANARLDIIYMSFWLAAGSIGTYSLANNVMSPVDLAASTLCVLITPAVARLGRSGGEDGRSAQVARVRRDALRSGLWATIVVVPLMVVSPIVVPLVFGGAFKPAVPLIWVLAPGYVLKSFASVVSSGAAGMRLPWAASAIEAAGLVGSVALLPVLLVFFGTMGAAVASTVAYGASAIAGLWLLRRSGRKAAHDREETFAPMEALRVF